jgi:predicted ATP-grasp superfamily ATP-dependent carboligase
MPEQAAVLIAAVSGRALAASARRAGFVPLVADCFGDDDTLALGHAHASVRLDARHGIAAGELLQALDRLAASHAPIGIVYGTGFEDRPKLLGRIARRWRLLGNAPETIARLKDSASFAALCRDCKVPHPQTRTERPADITGWVMKRAGGAGGTHVGNPIDRKEDRGTMYYQHRVPGRSVSALVLGNGRAAIVLGFSAQWASPGPGRPFRYGGAARPAGLASELSAALIAAVQRLASAVPVIGLNSFDFMVDADAFWLLEINPRPGATLDIFEPCEGSLFGLHVCACEGALPERPPYLSGAAAACIVYADRDVRSVPVMDWPAWAADRQRAATSIRTDDPFCTVLARAPTAADAEQIVKQRAAAILAMLDARLHDELAAH